MIIIVNKIDSPFLSLSSNDERKFCLQFSLLHCQLRADSLHPSVNVCSSCVFTVELLNHTVWASLLFIKSWQRVVLGSCAAWELGVDRDRDIVSLEFMSILRLTFKMFWCTKMQHLSIVTFSFWDGLSPCLRFASCGWDKIHWPKELQGERADVCPWFEDIVSHGREEKAAGSEVLKPLASHLQSRNKCGWMQATAAQLSFFASIAQDSCPGNNGFLSRQIFSLQLTLSRAHLKAHL